MRKRIDSFTDSRNQFARRLEFALKADGISQTEFASMIGVSCASVSAYVSGRRYPCFETLMAIQKKLDISLDWLCGLVD